MVKIGDYLIALAIAMVTITSIVGLLRHQAPLDILQFGLVLIVAAIPAAMPAVLSVCMTVGASALAKKEAIVSKLVAIDEMAGVDILCADKTGTITKNELTVGEVKTFKKYTENDVLLYASLASREEDKDPIDDAIIAKAKAMDGVPASISSYKVSSFKPFDPVSKRTEATVQGKDGHGFQVTKGAPQVVLSLLHDKGVEGAVNEDVNGFAVKGYRALGVARTDGGEGLAVRRAHSALRPATGRLGRDDQDRAVPGDSREDGHRRPRGHSQGGVPGGGAGHEHSHLVVHPRQVGQRGGIGDREASTASPRSSRSTSTRSSTSCRRRATSSA